MILSQDIDDFVQDNLEKLVPLILLTSNIKNIDSSFNSETLNYHLLKDLLYTGDFSC